MRVTTKMMNNSIIGNINSNKNSVFDLQEQYASGKVIQRPSQNPVVASRSLRLRSSISEMEQFLKKNIPDAMSWMDVTESAMKNMEDVMQYIYGDIVHGANDPLTCDERNMIQENLVQLKQQIYQEGNANYAGRYVFTGYRTDDSLTFQYKSDDILYKITEHFDPKEDIKNVTRIANCFSIQDCKEGKITDGQLNGDTQTKEVKEMYRIRLGYEDINYEMVVHPEDVGLSDEDKKRKVMASNDIMITYKDKDNNEVTLEPYKYNATSTITSSGLLLAKSTDDDIYSKLEDPSIKMLFLVDTGEVIMNRDTYNDVYAGSDLDVVYDKNRFNEGDVKPHHYFDCETYPKLIPSQSGKIWDDTKSKVKKYTNESQNISYEVNFSQNININSQLSNILPLGFSRCIDDISHALGDVNYCEKKIADVKEILDDPTLNETQHNEFELLLTQCQVELALKNKALTNSFQNAMAEMKEYQTSLSISLADLGSRYKRLELIEDRLSVEVMDYTELLSTNEDVDMVETYVKFNSMQNIYNASLNMASKISQNSLLDFI